MKYLLVLAVLGVAFWLWRNNRQSAQMKDHTTSQTKSSASSLAKPLPMLQCSACGVHLPQSDAVTGRLGSYCSASHRTQQEG
jgi:uncharacterized protein